MSNQERIIAGHRSHPRLIVAAAVAALSCLVGAATPCRAADEVRAAYFYHHMDVAHLDRLAATGFNRAVIHWNGDSLDEKGAVELAAFRVRGSALGIEIVPQWAVQQPTRLVGRPLSRRYTWGDGTVEPEVACPLDSVYWRTAVLGRAGEFFAADSTLERLAIDLELYWGSRHHFVDGACRCPFCVAEYLGGADVPIRDPRKLSGLMGWQESALDRMLTSLLEEFARVHPGVELGVFDLDLDSFVHRALARALRRSGVRTADYCERSYSTGASALAAARTRLDGLGLTTTPLLGGLWLKRFPPSRLPQAMKDVLQRADGHFIFTTYSLWLEPAQLKNDYVVESPQADYWDALTQGNSP